MGKEELAAIERVESRLNALTIAYVITTAIYASMTFIYLFML